MNFDLLTYYPWIVGIAFSTIGALVGYFLYLRPRSQEALPNERQLGYVTLWLREHGVVSGWASTAANTLEGLLTQVLENETGGDLKLKLAEAKEFLRTFNPMALKVDRDIWVLLFDENYLDQRYMDAAKDRPNSFLIQGVQDVCSAGEWGGLKFFGVKLSKEVKVFTDGDRKRFSAVLDVCMYLRDAAKNTSKIAFLKEENKDQRTHIDIILKTLAEMRSKLDRASHALSQKPLTQIETEIKGAWKDKIKEWFTWPQLVTGLAGYLLAPYIIQFAGWQVVPPVTTYFAAGMTALGFFIIPLGKRLFGRWL
jgi:hypothetical protein